MPFATRQTALRNGLIAMAAISFIALPAIAALKAGAAATDFTTQAVLGGKAFSFNLNAALKKGPVVLYFFPKAFTSGCTVEAHEFAEATDDFNKAGATVIGISADNIETLTKFSVEECRNKFAVAVGSKAVIKSYKTGLPVIGGSDRTTYVIAPTGKIVWSYSKLSVKGHVTGALAAVRAYQGAVAAK
jgi:thioredoxin-dependent peroxiredoxin